MSAFRDCAFVADVVLLTTESLRDQMSLEFTPIADQHAIEACAMVVRLFQPLDPESMDRLREELFAIASAADLPSKHAMTGATFFFGPQGVAAPPPPVTGGAGYFSVSRQTERSRRSCDAKLRQ